MPGKGIRRRLPAPLMLAAWLGLASPSIALAQDVSEYGIKAVLFHRLAQFVYWPESERKPSPLVYCVAGKNPFSSTFSQLAQSGGGEIRIAPADLTGCHLLFISRSESASVDAWLARADSRRLITVSDIAGFARSGGMIELPLEGERVGIVINRKASQKQGFEFNAQLLRLARVIE